MVSFSEKKSALEEAEAIDEEDVLDSGEVDAVEVGSMV
jgi:hypothetical protein